MVGIYLAHAYFLLRINKQKGLYTVIIQTNGPMKVWARCSAC